MELTQVLEATLSPDTQAIQVAQHQLEEAAIANLAEFLTALANELANVSKSHVARIAAGLQLKNYLTSKDLVVKVAYQQRWLNIDSVVRSHIKTLILATLGTETHQYRSAAQCIAYVAAAELQVNSWPELIPTLLSNVTTTQNTEQLKEASLEAIGYVCEELDPKYLASHSNPILTAIVQGMRKEEPSDNVRLAATKALLNSLEFTKANFEKENERHFIMQVVCEATQCNSIAIQVAALQNLVKIMSLYYEHMEAYMGPALFAITLEAMKSSTDEVVLQGIEFWSTVCDEETDLAIDAMEAQESGQPPQHTSRFYVKGAVNYLVPILLVTLAKQDEFDDEDDWNPCKAAGVCLALLASCCEDAIVPTVLPFVKEHISNADWKFRDAAIMALGSIMEGPSELQKNIMELVGPLIQLMSDEIVQVRDSAAWSLGRVCEQCPNVLLDDQYLPHLLGIFVTALSQEPRVAINVCWALSSLAEAAGDACDGYEEEDTPDTFPLSSYFQVIVENLLIAADRSDTGSGNLRSSAYEALMDMIKYSAKDCYAVILKLTNNVLEKLQLLNSQVTSSGADRQQLTDIGSLLCATLMSLLRKVIKEDADSISDTVMKVLLSMLHNAAHQVGGVQEDVIMTIGVLVEVLGDGFLKYMETFMPYLLSYLSNIADVQVCIASIGLVGDLCRHIGSGIYPFCAELMSVFFSCLINSSVHRSINPQILSVLGDMALAIGTEFGLYLSNVFGVLQQAGQITVDKDDYDMVDYVNELRDACLECYTGIIQGLKGDSNGKEISAALQGISSQVPTMIQFLSIIAKDENKSESNLCNAIGLLGDLCASFGSHLSPLVTDRILNQLIAEGKQSRIKRTKTVALWAAKELKQIQQSSPK